MSRVLSPRQVPAHAAAEVHFSVAPAALHVPFSASPGSFGGVIPDKPPSDEDSL